MPCVCIRELPLQAAARGIAPGARARTSRWDPPRVCEHSLEEPGIPGGCEDRARATTRATRVARYAAAASAAAAFLASSSATRFASAASNVSIAALSQLRMTT